MSQTGARVKLGHMVTHYTSDKLKVMSRDIEDNVTYKELYVTISASLSKGN